MSPVALPVAIVAESAILAAACLSVIGLYKLCSSNSYRSVRRSLRLVVMGIGIIALTLAADITSLLATYFDLIQDHAGAFASPWIWPVLLVGLAITFFGLAASSGEMLHTHGYGMPTGPMPSPDVKKLPREQTSFEENQKLLASVLENVPARITIKDLDGRFVYLNNAAVKYFGHPRSNLIGSVSTNFARPEMRRELRALDERVIANRETITDVSAVPLLDRDGDTRMVAKFPMISELDEVVGVVTVSNDISQMKDAETVIRASEARAHETMDQLRKITDALPVHISYVDAAGNYVYVNEAYEKWYGLPRSEIEGRHADSFAGKKNIETVQSVLSRSLAGEAFNWSGWIERPDGDRRFVDRSCIPNFDDDGSFIGFFSSMTDITERRKTEEALEESESLLKAVMENVPVGISIKDTEGRFILVNPVAEKRLGEREEDLIGKKTAENLSAEIASDMRKLDAVVQNTGKPITHEMNVSGTGGEEISLVSKFPIPSSTGEMVGIGTIATNITDIKDIEKALKQSESRLRNVLEQQPQLVGRVGVDGKHTFVNDAICSLHGKSREALIGTPIAPDDSPESQRKNFREHFAGITKKKPTAEMDHSVIDGNGKLRWFHFISKATFDEFGEIIEYQYFGLDITDQKQAEEAREAAEDTLRVIMDAVPVLIAYIDTDLRYHMVNKAYERWFGLPTNEIQGRHVRDVIGEHAAYLIAPELDAARAGRKVTYEKSMPYQGIGERHVQGTFIPDKSTDGEMRGFISVVTDITNAKRAEEELRRSEERYRTVVDSQSDLIGRSLPDGTRTFANDALCRFVGVPREELLGQSVYSRLPDEDAAKYRKILHSETTETQYAERRAITANNELRWVHWIDTPIRDDSGRVVEIQSVGRDITDRKLAEIELTESETRYRRLVETMNDGLVIQDENDEIVFANDKSLEILGWERENIIGKTTIEIFAGKHEELFDGVYRMRTRGESSRYDFEITARDNTPIIVHINGYPIFDENSVFKGSWSIITDVTEKTRAEEQLKASEERYRRLVATMNDGLVIEDENSIIVFANEKMLELYNMRREDVIGKKSVEVVPQYEAKFKEIGCSDEKAKAADTQLRPSAKTEQSHSLRLQAIRSWVKTVITREISQSSPISPSKKPPRTRCATTSVASA